MSSTYWIDTKNIEQIDLSTMNIILSSNMFILYVKNQMVNVLLLKFHILPDHIRQQKNKLIFFYIEHYDYHSGFTETNQVTTKLYKYIQIRYIYFSGSEFKN